MRAAEGAEGPVGRAESLISCLVGVIALRSSRLFDSLTARSPEAVGAVLETAAQSAPEQASHAATPVETP
ncbi:hypothetical protein [Streptomyces umbrinus]|uniref:hypothetical protein n=1 Tax=Streptomyces umbrinus TaxID=67370 RepID=UPI00343DA6BE